MKTLKISSCLVVCFLKFVYQMFYYTLIILFLSFQNKLVRVGERLGTTRSVTAITAWKQVVLLPAVQAEVLIMHLFLLLSSSPLSLYLANIFMVLS